MTRVFVDTSALYALLDRDDANHRSAKARWETLLDADDALLTTNYVVVEATALVQHRLGLPAVRALVDDLLGVVETLWIEPSDHEAAVLALLAARRRKLSLVDCASLQVMHRLRIRDAFAFDGHFEEHLGR